MCQLRSNIDSSVATRRQRPLLVQRVRPLLQDERHKQTSHQAKTTHCKSFAAEIIPLLLIEGILISSI
jgi:hypothetical protein